MRIPFKTRFRELSWSQRLLVLAAAVLALLVLFKYAPLPEASVVMPGTVEHEKVELAELRGTLNRAVRRSSRHADAFSHLRSEAELLFWQMKGKNPATELQSELDRVSRSAQVTIRTMGTPRTSDFSDNIQSIEVTINTSGTMREIGRLLVAVRNAPRRLEWNTCTIRPTNPADPASITVNGRIAAYYLAPAAEAAVFGHEAGVRPE